MLSHRHAAVLHETANLRTGTGIIVVPRLMHSTSREERDREVWRARDAAAVCRAAGRTARRVSVTDSLMVRRPGPTGTPATPKPSPVTRVQVFTRFRWSGLFWFPSCRQQRTLQRSGHKNLHGSGSKKAVLREAQGLLDPFGAPQTPLTVEQPRLTEVEHKQPRLAGG